MNERSADAAPGRLGGLVIVEHDEAELQGPHGHQHQDGENEGELDGDIAGSVSPERKTECSHVQLVRDQSPT